MKKPSLKERLGYWFDTRMSKGVISMIRFLAFITLVIVIVLSAVVAVISGADEEMTFGDILWDNLATVINAWMPSSGDGGIVYLISTALVAVVGLLVTSVLVGIFASAVEEKLGSLRKGKSDVLETGHTVVLGFTPGETTLISELCAAAGDEKRVIVVGSSLEKDEAEDAIRESVDIPKNVTVICRSVDICDPSTLGCLSIPESRAVVISPAGDSDTVRAILAVYAVRRDANRLDVPVIAGVDDDFCLASVNAVGDPGLIAVGLHRFTARVIAHSCTQPGLSGVFSDIFDFDGSEFYIIPAGECAGLSFASVCDRADGAVPVGFVRGGDVTLVPAPDEILGDDDSLIIFAPEEDSLTLSAPSDVSVVTRTAPAPDRSGRVLVIGSNDSFPTVFDQLASGSSGISDIRIAGAGERANEIREAISRFTGECRVSVIDGDVRDGAFLEEITSDADHVILLAGGTNGGDGDTEGMMLLLRLREIKRRLGRTFNITTEMRHENNRALVLTDDRTDFVISSSLSGFILAQLTEDSDLRMVFQELLAWWGRELYLRRASDLGLTGRTLTVRELRMAALGFGFAVLGYMNDDETVLNPALGDEVTLGEEDSLIVIGEQ